MILAAESPRQKRSGRFEVFGFNFSLTEITQCFHINGALSDWKRVEIQDGKFLRKNYDTHSRQSVATSGRAWSLIGSSAQEGLPELKEIEPR